MRDLWDGAAHREERYAATGADRPPAYRARQDPDAVPLYRHLIVTGAWWDHVDEIAAATGSARSCCAHPGDRAPRDAGWATGRRPLAAPDRHHLPARQPRATDVALLLRRHRAQPRAPASSSSARRSAGRCASTPTRGPKPPTGCVRWSARTATGWPRSPAARHPSTSGDHAPAAGERPPDLDRDGGRGDDSRGPYAARVSTSVSQQRDILRLAVPAFLALVAEPLFLLADSAIIGHLGTAQLAGLGVASAALVTAANSVRLPRLRHHQRRRPPARRRSRARRPRRRHRRRSGWRSGSAPPPPPLVALRRRAALRALRRLRPAPGPRPRPTCASPRSGIPAMLVVLAATGVLRGLQDTRTPLVASVVGFGANIALNLVLVYGARLGHRRLRARAPSSPRPAWRPRWSPSGHGTPRRAAAPACSRTPARVLAGRA